MPRLSGALGSSCLTLFCPFVTRVYWCFVSLVSRHFGTSSLTPPFLHRSSCLTNSRTTIPCIVPSVFTMRVRTLEIRWHDNKPISTCDFQPLSFKKARPANERDFVTQSYRLATGGEDNNVRVCISFFEDFVSFVRRGVVC